MKYNLAAELIDKYELPKLRRPSRPSESEKIAYQTLSLENYLTYTDLVSQVPSSNKIDTNRPIPMELLPINDNNGQMFGYIIYRKAANFNFSDTYKVSVSREKLRK